MRRMAGLWAALLLVLALRKTGHQPYGAGQRHQGDDRCSWTMEAIDRGACPMTIMVTVSAYAGGGGQPGLPVPEGEESPWRTC